MKVLVTGAAGFIGFHVSKKLLDLGHEVIGLDNINDYYDVNLKYNRLRELGIYREDAEVFNSECCSNSYSNFGFFRMNLEDKSEITELFENEKFEVVCHLGAQAGVRYSIEKPDVYIQSNIVGFLNILEASRYNNIKHLVYASSSSVYGKNIKIPFSESDQVDTPVSLYAATKKSNELMAHTYSHLYGIKIIGLRFFTVYGPWGRPDMAMFLFTDAILNDRPIKVFNNGNLSRDFTYIDDIVEGVVSILLKEAKTKELYKIYNIGNSKPVRLLDFIEEIEKYVGKTAKKNMMPMQPGDVNQTFADVSELKTNYKYSPNTPISEGVTRFIDWYKNYYKIK